MDKIIKFGFGSILPGFECTTAFEKGDNLYRAQHVQEVQEVHRGGKVEISARVVRQTAISAERHKVSLELDAERTAVTRRCSCPAGAGAKCKHIAALIVFINFHDGSSKTSHQQAWGRPNEEMTHKALKEKYAKPKRIESLIPKYEAPPINAHIDTQFFPPNKNKIVEAGSVIDRYLTTRDAFDANPPQPVPVVPPSLDFDGHLLLHLQKAAPVFGDTVTDLELPVAVKDYCVSNIIVNEDSVVKIMTDTKSQSKDDVITWKKCRRNRISASERPHRIKVCRKGYDHLIKSMFDLQKQFLGNAATMYGNKNEETARKEFMKSANATVAVCGLVINVLQPWLCGSPDGIILDDSGMPIKVLEIKCPHSCRNKPLYVGSTISVDFLIWNNEKELALKPSHKYYTQCQFLMYVTGLNTCVFYVWSPSQQITIEIARDDNFLIDCIPECNSFFFNYMVPHFMK